jgi:hypothetical protein
VETTPTDLPPFAFRLYATRKPACWTRRLQAYCCKEKHTPASFIPSGQTQTPAWHPASASEQGRLVTLAGQHGLPTMPHSRLQVPASETEYTASHRQTPPWQYVFVLPQLHATPPVPVAQQGWP